MITGDLPSAQPPHRSITYCTSSNALKAQLLYTDLPMLPQPCAPLPRHALLLLLWHRREVGGGVGWLQRRGGAARDELPQQAGICKQAAKRQAVRRSGGPSHANRFTTTKLTPPDQAMQGGTAAGPHSCAPVAPGCITCYLDNISPPGPPLSSCPSTMGQMLARWIISSCPMYPRDSWNCWEDMPCRQRGAGGK